MRFKGFASDHLFMENSSVLPKPMKRKGSVPSVLCKKATDPVSEIPLSRDKL